MASTVNKMILEMSVENILQLKVGSLPPCPPFLHLPLVPHLNQGHTVHAHSLYLPSHPAGGD